MNIKEENICRLCLKVVEGDYEIIDEIKRNMFEVLLLRVNLDISKDPIICRDCTEISIKCFDFKSTTTNQSKYIIKQENYMKISDDDIKCGFCSQDSSGNDLILLDTLKNDITFADMLQVLMPETDFDVTKNPGICILCRQDLECYIKFAKNCWIVEDKINKHYRHEGIPSFVQIKLSEFLLKTDAELDYIKKELEDISETHSEVYEGKLIKAEEPLDIKDEDVKLQEISCEAPSDIPVHKLNKPRGLDNEITTRKTSTQSRSSTPTLTTKTASEIGRQGRKHITDMAIYKCSMCIYESKHKSNLKRHMLSHKESSEVEMYKCSKCTYETKYKSILKRHIVIHKDVTEVEIYKCSICTFETRHKKGLKDHLLIHKDVAEVEIYKCSTCTYKTKHKRYLHSHMLIHKDVTQVEMYKCPKCTFQAKRKGDFQGHILIHKDVSEVETYKCSMCTYVTKRKRYLYSHMLVHKDVAQAEVYKCSTCAFETRRKGSLKDHLLIHKNVTEERYKCSVCTFRARRKFDLQSHTLVHKEIAKVEMYKCSMCSFETKYKGYLKSHMLVHKDVTEVEMNKCSLCDYKTKRKGNLKNHTLIHKHITEVEIYKCSTCTYETNRKYSLKVHLRRHQ